MRVFLSSFKGRLIGFLCLLLSSMLAAWAWNSWQETRAYVEDQERTKLLTIVQTLAPMLDGDLHERAISEHSAVDSIEYWETAPEWLGYLRKKLIEGSRYNDLTSPVYTMRVKDDARSLVLAEPDEVHSGAMELVMSSSATPEWRHSADYCPEMRFALFDGRGATSELRETELGSRISAYAPIRDSQGQIVALLAAEAPVSEILTTVRDRLAKRATFVFAVIVWAVLGSVIMTLSVTRALTYLQSAARRLAAGDYRTPFHIPEGAQEIRDVARAFESARLRISTHIEAQDRLNSALEATREQAESANQAKSVFLANMSHELRTPLNAMLGFAQILRQGELDPEQREMLDRVQRASESLHEIVGDILDFSRISEGDLHLVETEFETDQLLLDVAHPFLEKAKRRGISLDWSCTADVPDALVGDAPRLRQILVHLVSNAMKFTEVGKIDVCASVEYCEDEHVCLRFDVHDTGIGIESATCEQLFEPFSQSEGNEGLSRGTGLGLSLCKKLCELMDGEIGVDTFPGEGSTFWFTVVLRLPEHVEASEPDPPAPLPRKASTARRILIAEDSAVNRRVALHMIRKLGYEGEVAVDGQEAVDAARSGDFDAILMDCQMPRMDGLEATRTIRQLEGRGATIPIIAFTADADPDERQRALDSGMNDFVQKPVALEQLEAVLTRWCTLHERPAQPSPLGSASA